MTHKIHCPDCGELVKVDPKFSEQLCRSCGSLFTDDTDWSEVDRDEYEESRISAYRNGDRDRFDTAEIEDDAEFHDLRDNGLI